MPNEDPKLKEKEKKKIKNKKKKKKTRGLTQLTAWSTHGSRPKNLDSGPREVHKNNTRSTTSL